MFNLNKFKMPKLLKNITKLLILLSILVPILCDRTHETNKSNIIDRRKVQDDSSYEISAEEHTQAPISGGCGSCKFREDVKNRNLEAIKGEVLRRMGFESAPNVTGRVRPPVPAHILAKVQEQVQGGYSGMQSDEPQYKTGPSISEEEDDFHIKTETVVTFAQPYPRLRHSWKGHDILHFQFSDSITKYHVSNATLNVYVKGVDKRPAPTFHLEVFKVFKSAEHSDTPGMLKVVSKKIAQPVGRAGDWIQIDISSMVSEWFKNFRENLGFIVNGSVNGKRVVFADSTTVDKGISKVPFVEITTREAKRRVRRSLGLNCDENTTNKICCRYPLTVDFEEFGYDFIIAPKRYEAYYCHGECEYMTLQKYAHTHLAKMASLNGASPCCAPKKMGEISMLYFDQHMNVVLGSLPGMVVQRCGCS